MADLPVRKIIPPGVSGGEGIKGIKRFGQDRESFEDQRDADAAKLSDVESTYKKIGAFKRGGKISSGGHTVHNYCAGGKVISSKNY